MKNSELNIVQEWLRTAALMILVLVSGFAGRAQLISNSKTKAEMQLMFQKQEQLAEGRSSQLFEVFKSPLTADEKQALEYLYAYMPLSDLADYEGGFFLQQVKTVLKARNEMSWGKTIPEDVFLHFVLPPRTNNENLDMFRVVMYDELKSRIAGMNMHDAALEVNHWCHEKMTYRGTDDRTSSPLASLKTSFGRCGEESTFTVTALRTIGIPARQVYTPRWAHTDDNHAWVEVWVDGKWYFFGACEPDPELNMGWFAEPARRAMLVHTRAYGAYYGSEPVIDRQDRFAELNLISNYAASKNIYIKVVGTDNTPVYGANVEYQLYNYAEFYPIAKGVTDPNGISSIATGLGDLLIWAYQDEKWGYRKISVDKQDSITVTISVQHVNGYFEKFDLIPPVEKTPLPSIITQSQRDLNSARLQKEDSIRSRYMSTFKDSAWVVSFASGQGLSADRLQPLFEKAYGNWKEIAGFISATPDPLKEWALLLLESVTEKDIRDTRAEILNDHFKNTFNASNPPPGENKEFFAENILSGRIANEMMLPWRGYIQNSFGEDFAKKVRLDINVLIDWIRISITTDNTANMHSRAPLSPRGVYELRVADSRSRDIFFVAVCRSFGLAARVNPATGFPQYFDAGKWINVAFEPVAENITDKGKVHFINPDAGFDTKYAINFTIARYKGGVYRTVDFDYGMKVSGFDANTEVEAGNYMLVTGNRQPDGSVLSSVTFFEIPANTTTDVAVGIRQDFTATQPWAKINTSDYQFKSCSNKEVLKLSNLVSGKGAILIWIDPDQEPSKHVMADIPAVKELVEKWGGSILFLISGNKVNASFKPSNFANLPGQSIFGWDKDAVLLNEIAHLRKQSTAGNLPVIVITDSKGNLLFYSGGYKIGIGEQIAKTIITMK